MQERQVLFKTTHGSRLYGLNHAGSDEDFYTVVTKKPYTGRGQGKAKYAKQSITGDEDSMVVDFGTWVEMCRSGVPQALEAMFSTMPIGDDSLAAYRSGFRVGTEVYSRYMDTIKSFALSEDEGIKKRRHALRLGWNLQDIRRAGRFNPTLNEFQLWSVNHYCTKPHGEVYELAKIIAWD